MAASTILLQSSDGQVFEAQKGAVLRSVLIAKKLQLRRKSHDNDKDKSPVVLDEIDGETLEKVIKYCDRHYEVDFSPDDEASVNSLDEFDVGVVNVDQTTFFNLIEVCFLSLYFYFSMSLYIILFIIFLLLLHVRCYCLEAEAWNLWYV